ncbi:uncharacterized protein [Nicotiana tomentosiformis]|uniref:uncharacterized protein n=1 Tax=Nicotiana tomentosiformis TaxID=4098 RepID=UPI00388CAE8A
MKIVAESPVRSEKDEKIISNLRRKVYDYRADLTKAEEELAKAREKLVKVAEERTRFAHQLKKKYDRGVTILREKLTTLENEMVQQTKDLKTETEHCYAMIYQLEKSMQKL